MKKTILLLFLLGQTLSIFAQKAQAPDPELQKLKANLAAAKHDTTRMMAYVDISMYFRDITKQLDSALVYGLKAEQLVNNYPQYYKSPMIWNNLGNVYKFLHDRNTEPIEKKNQFQQALNYYRKSINTAQKLNNEEYVLRTSYNLNSLNTRLENKYNFFKGCFELINHIQKIQQPKSLYSHILASTYLDLCHELDYEIGSKNYNNYFSQLKKLTPKSSLHYESILLLEFEQHSLTWKKSDEQNLLKEYKECKAKIKIFSLSKELDGYLAQYYFTIKDYKKSFQLAYNHNNDNFHNYYHKEINYIVKQIYKSELGILSVKYMRMGQSAYMLNRNQEAIKYLNKAIHYMNLYTTGLGNEKYITLLYLVKAYKKAGKYREALACNEQADVLYKQMHDVGIQALMAENDVHLEEIKQEKKVQAARTQTLLKEQEIKVEKRQKNILIIISILALLSAAWAVYSFIKTRKQNQIISQQAAALEESNLLKDKIFALLSHDLRSPINRLVISLNQSIESQRSAIQSELKGVQDILNNILYWASMQLKKAEPVYTSVPLQALAEALIDEYQYALEEKNITFLNSIEKECELKTDEHYLKIVLRNLISNAIKFTPNNGYIQISCIMKEGIAEIVLRDTGVGIATQKIDRLFQLPVPSVGTNQEKGTGLGLSLSADIVKKLGGNLNIQSQEGKGTQVVVALPLVA